MGFAASDTLQSGSSGSQPTAEGACHSVLQSALLYSSALQGNAENNFDNFSCVLHKALHDCVTACKHEISTDRCRKRTEGSVFKHFFSGFH